jgi:hypothetical protein
VETVNSMLKWRLGLALRARGDQRQCREIILQVITHNRMITMRIEVFTELLVLIFLASSACREGGG